ncbi:hypothetical protein RI065_06460 [Mycoplasmatota bacterium zrk1]
MGKGLCIVAGVKIQNPKIVQVDFVEEREFRPSSDDIGLFNDAKWVQIRDIIGGGCMKLRTYNFYFQKRTHDERQVIAYYSDNYDYYRSIGMTHIKTMEELEKLIRKRTRSGSGNNILHKRTVHNLGVDKIRFAALTLTAERFVETLKEEHTNNHVTILSAERLIETYRSELINDYGNYQDFYNQDILPELKIIFNDITDKYREALNKNPDPTPLRKLLNGSERVYILQVFKERNIKPDPVASVAASVVLSILFMFIALLIIINIDSIIPILFLALVVIGIIKILSG